MAKKLLSKSLELISNHTPFVTATIVTTHGSSPRKVGAKMIIYHDHEDIKIFGTIGGGGLEMMVMKDAEKVLEAKKPMTNSYPLDESTDQACGGTADIYLDYTGRVTDLYIFGAGHVGQALTKVMHETNFSIHLIDEREEWTLSEHVPENITRHPIPWKEFVASVDWKKGEIYVVIMTHNHKYDAVILDAVLRKSPTFIGLMGSASKWKTTQKSLLENGVTQEQLDSVICPVGDKSVGKGPAEIAIGIANQLLKKFSATYSER
jgi:xanthine dehydrogenase accessory factor